MERMAEGFVRRRRELMGRGEVGRGRRYPHEMAALAVRFAEGALAAGWSQRRIAQRLEIPLATLARWRRGDGRREEVGLHEVVLTGEPDAERQEPGGAGVVMVTPDGFRIEGLSIGAVASLLEALRR
jgi:hypothetical protein